jgi:SHS family lactate transporter-like MFS transporter
MSLKDWNYFLLGWSGWTVDAFDFFVSSVTAASIAKSLDVSIKSITWGITLVLMFRSLGAIIFGFISDTYGRRPAYLICAAMFVVIEIGTGFVQTLGQFLAVRALFGISMGGMYGAASATALESQPIVSRSILGGIYLPGYNFGYILAIIFWRAFEFSPHSWRALFWFSAAPPFLLFVWRWFTPEHEFFLAHKRAQREQALSEGKISQANSPVKQFVADLKHAVKNHWLLFVYLIFLMSGMNFTSHGAQDLFPVFLQNQIGLSANERTVTMVIVNIGAIIGGVVVGQLSELTGRRLSMIISVLFGSAFIYLAFMSTDQSKIIAGNFFLNFAVMGVWGVISVHLIELSPPQFRSLFAGLAYQLGNLASSASSTIQAQAGEKFPLPEIGPGVYDYGKVMSFFMTGVNLFLLICLILGPENFHRNLAAGTEADTTEVFDTIKIDENTVRDEEKGVEVQHQERSSKE